MDATKTVETQTDKLLNEVDRDVCMCNNLNSIVQNLKSLSDKLAADSLSDSYDHFSKYVSSLLRGLPKEKAFKLKKKLVNDILEALSAPERNSSDSSLIGSVPPSNNSLNSQESTGPDFPLLPFRPIRIPASANSNSAPHGSSHSSRSTPKRQLVGVDVTTEDEFGTNSNSSRILGEGGFGSDDEECEPDIKLEDNKDGILYQEELEDKPVISLVKQVDCIGNDCESDADSFICDACSVRCSKKEELIHHIQENHPGTIVERRQDTGKTIGIFKEVKQCFIQVAEQGNEYGVNVDEQIKREFIDTRDTVTNVPLELHLNQTHESGKRKWDRKNCCLFCSKLVTNFCRHLKRNHSKELEIRKILSYQQGSKERKVSLEKLRRKGNFQHNQKCIRQQSGSIVVVRRPRDSCDPTKYLPCKYCFGFFSRKKLFRHLKYCKNRSTDRENPNRNAQAFASTLILSMPDINCSDTLKDSVLNLMRHDLISETVKNDPLICSYGTHLMQTQKENNKRVIVSQKLRELGRLVLNLKDKYPEKTELEDFIKPEHYMDIVAAVKEITGFSELNGSFKTPTLVTRLGKSLKVCADLLEVKALQNNNKLLEDTALKFNTIMSTHWQTDLPVTGFKTLYKGNLNKPLLLALAEDLKKLQSFLLEKENKLANELKLNPTIECWQDLTEVTFLQVMLLNFRRVANIEKIEISHYINRLDLHSSELIDSLSPLERVMCERITCFEMMEEVGNNVTILLTLPMKDNFDLLISTRTAANVFSENPYFFAIPETFKSTIQGHEIIEKVATLCGAKNLNNLSLTRLRKHIATMYQLTYLSSSEMEHLARFMGQLLDANSENYQLPQNTVDVVKMSKILLLMEKGDIANLQSKSVEEIDMNLNSPVSDVESDNIEYSADEQTTHTELLAQTDAEYSVPQCSSRKADYSEDQPATHEVVNQTESIVTYEVNPDIVIKTRKACTKTPWTKEEKEAVLKHFTQHILSKKVPNKEECVKCLRTESVLSSRTWRHLKFCVKNMFKLER